MARLSLTGDAAFYLDPAGSDANDGLTPDTPWQHLQHFIEYACGALDLGCRYRVIGNAAPGTYRENLYTCDFLGFNTKFGYEQIRLQATDSNPANTRIDGGGAIGLLTQNTITPMTLAGFQWKNCAECVYGDSAGLIALDGCDFAEATGAHVLSIYDSRIVLINHGYSISGPAPVHRLANEKGMIFAQGGHAVTISGNPLFTYFDQSVRNSLINSSGTTYLGSARGQKFICHSGGGISTGTGDVDHLPGDVAGDASGSGLRTPGWYD